MLTTGHCATHPSREAQLRCRTCGAWLCDRCVHVLAGHIYCDRWCQLRHLIRTTAGAAVEILGRRLAPAWCIAVVAITSTALLWAVGSQVAVVLDMAVDPVLSAPAVAPPARVAGHLEPVEGGWRLRVRGTPGTSVLVLRDGQLAAVVRLDGNGHGPGPLIPSTGQGLTLELLPLQAAGVTVQAVPPVTAASPRLSPAVSQPPPPARSSGRASSSNRGEPPAPPILHLVPDAGPRIAITFDGGSSSNGSAALLDLFRRLDLRTTLFLTGEFIERDPELVRRALRDGHEIGNHTYSHPHLTTYAETLSHALLPHVNREMLHTELRRAEEAFARATGQRMAPLWRAPYGEENGSLRRWGAELGYLHVRWSSLGGASLDSRDWVDESHGSIYQDSTRIMQRLLRFPSLDGGIVLMHLSSHRPEPPWDALPGFVEELRERGLEPVRVSELLLASRLWRGQYQQALERHGAVFSGSAVADSEP